MWCGCFHCLQVYEATEVVDWVDDGESPLCPRCGVDAVMIGVTDLLELLRMKRVRFGRGGIDPASGTPSDDLSDN